MRRRFQRFQGFDVQRVENAPGELRADAGNGEKELLRLQRAAQPLELRPSPGGQHLGEGRGDRAADSGKRRQAVAALARRTGRPAADRGLRSRPPLAHRRRRESPRRPAGARDRRIREDFPRERRLAGDRRVEAPCSCTPLHRAFASPAIYRRRPRWALRGVKSPLGLAGVRTGAPELRQINAAGRVRAEKKACFACGRARRTLADAFDEGAEMPHKQILFRSAAREKILRGATQLADAVRVTLGPRSKSVLIERKWGAPIVCNDGVTIAKEFDLKDAEENLGARMLRQAAEKTGDMVGDGTSTSTILAHAIFADGVRNVVAGASAIDIKRGLDRACKRAVETLKAMSRPVKHAKGKGPGRRHFRAQRCRDRRNGRRRDGQGRQRGRDHGRRIQDDRNDARSGRGHAVRSRLHLALFRHRSGKDRSRPRKRAGADLRSQDLRAQGPAVAARRSRQVRAAVAGGGRGRRGRGARHADRQSYSRRA